MKRGQFIVIEGIDGSGITTQVAAVAERLHNTNVAVLTAKEPTTNPIGKLIRERLQGGEDWAEEMALLFAADRMEHKRGIQHMLGMGFTVICDRYVLSSLVYQGPEVDFNWVMEINQHALVSDATIFLDVPLTVAAERRTARGLPDELYEHHNVLAKARDHYLRFMREGTTPDLLGRRFVVDGSQPIPVVTNSLFEVVQSVRHSPAQDVPPPGPAQLAYQEAQKIASDTLKEAWPVPTVRW